MPLDLKSNEAAVQRMESAFDLIVNFEDAWDQSVWRSPSETSGCGTALCFAGWASVDSGYKQLIPDPAVFAALGDLPDPNDSGDFFSVVAIPPGDPLQESEYAEPDLDRWSRGMEAPELDELERLVAQFPPGTKFMSAERLSWEPLGVNHRSTISRVRLLSSNAFDWANSLEHIRRHIDRARENADMPPRDFATEPVKVRIDATTPESAHADVRKRVRAFNKRAVADGVIETSDGR